MNSKNKGEIGERIAIGELAKFEIDVLLPLSDNLPFDFVVYLNNKMYKCQVKTSTQNYKLLASSLSFDLTSSNWHKKTIKKYSKEEVDVFILCDLKNIYLLSFNELKGRTSFSLRRQLPSNGQIKKINLCKDYILSQNRIQEVFN